MRLAIFDLDGTITRHDTLALFLWAYMRRHPARLPRLLAAVPAGLRFLRDRDHGRFKGALIHAVMVGATTAQIAAINAAFVPWLLAHCVYAAALQAIRQHRDAGDHLLLLSASTDLYVPEIGRALGFDQVICTGVQWRDGRLEGHLSTPNRRGEEKRRCVQELIARQPDRTTAYGNAASDLAHLALVDEAFLINGSAAARAQARAIWSAPGTGSGRTVIHCVRWQ